VVAGRIEIDDVAPVVSGVDCRPRRWWCYPRSPHYGSNPP